MSTRRNNKKKTASRRPVRRREPVYAMVQPKHMNICLKVISTAVIAAASPQLIKRWNPNSAYIPETGGGSGATPGYADWAQLYGYYRVISYRVRFTAVNNEAFPVIVYFINSNADPTTSNNSTIATNRLSGTRALSAKGGQDRWEYVSPRYTIAQIVGSAAPYTDDLYSALINASPADITWFGLGVQSIGGANVPNGISVSVELLQYVKFYDALPQI